jgi:hypothetical protein
MTATEMLDQFIATLNGQIEGAKSCLENADAFQAVCVDVEQLIKVDLQTVMLAFGEKGPGEADRQRLEECLAKLVDLESRSRARVVWAQDFEDYIRRSASEGE